MNLEKEMTSPPTPPKTKLQSHLWNGDAHAVHRSSPLRRGSVNGKEREALTASIKSSNCRRQPIDLDIADKPQINGHAPYPPVDSDDDAESDGELDVPPRDPGDEAVETSVPTSTRPASPYIRPPIDFDGLSWPSK